MQWYTRAIAFGDAVLSGDWSHTYQRYHPGVTTMWLCGAGLRLFSWLHGVSSEVLTGVVPAKPGVIHSAVSAGVLPAAFAISSSIVLAYIVLRRLLGGKTAVAAAVLMALDPFYLTHSKMIHVDGLLTAGMFLSALFLLDYLLEPRMRQLVWSGFFAGLSFLTKTPSLFLVPYALVLLGLRQLAILAERERERERARARELVTRTGSTD
ncbi:MAG: glycosyltransferase family 39 protein [Anaerolineae bacterium]|jgi:dolichyl-phosphate-mannose--protein O-mannosyl transferase